MENSYHHKEILDEVLKALTAIEDRAEVAVEKYAGPRSSNRNLKKCKKIIDNCDIQLRTLEIIGVSGIAQFTKVRNVLDTANMKLERALSRRR